MPHRSRLATAYGGLVLVLAPVAGAQQVGLFFDTEAHNCVGSVGNFDSVLVHAIAIVEPGTELYGAVVRLEMPTGFRIWGPPRLHKRAEASGELTSSAGLDIRFEQCLVTDRLVQLFSFVLMQWVPGGGTPIPDVVLELKGGTVGADSTMLTAPHLRLCPPPGGEPVLVEARSHRATVNCTAQCPCTVAVVQSSWSWFKQLYMGP